ncbi:hypothetical protein BB560_003795 [Smittium megazygosporum]|uniref:BZIP domain-containing protein n=1 Tax=Smittium megazygosporum TaxID=133381 RepID=A0A2T9ZB41_9FUNG|nr:hypothetical protein BB560_003795 [Smittium megazygosporum]
MTSPYASLQNRSKKRSNTPKPSLPNIPSSMNKQSLINSGLSPTLSRSSNTISSSQNTPSHPNVSSAPNSGPSSSRTNPIPSIQSSRSQRSRPKTATTPEEQLAKAERNRAAQRAFRQRRDQYVKELEWRATQAEELQHVVHQLAEENQSLRMRIDSLIHHINQFGLSVPSLPPIPSLPPLSSRQPSAPPQQPFQQQQQLQIQQQQHGLHPPIDWGPVIHKGPI